jgi:large subunit ribosomal protein L4
MPQVDLYTIKGTKSGKISLPKEIFKVPVNEALMAQSVRVYLSNQRKARAKSKTRSEINLTKSKWFRQKGTGRARHGAKSAPIFVGGGTAHGPKGIENFKLKMSKVLKKKALFSALSQKLEEKKILVIKDFGKLEPKTKQMADLLSKFKLGKDKVSLVLPKDFENVKRASGNIKNLNLLQADLINPYQVLNSNQLLFAQESIEELEKKFLKKK